MESKVKVLLQKDKDKKRIEHLEYAIQGIKEIQKGYGYFGKKVCQDKIDKFNAEVKELKDKVARV